MAQTTQLVEKQKPVTSLPAQVIALDSRPGARSGTSKKYVRNLRLSDLLSRHLEIRQIIEIFMSEIAKHIDYDGFRFTCDEADLLVEHGQLRGHEASYRLRVQNRQLGELTLLRSERFGSAQLNELEEMMCCLIYPLKNALLYQVALKSAYRDPLTGLNNRLAMEKNLPREIELAKRHRQPMALLVMDLDGFKQINDGHGHDRGDQILREVGQVISQVVRNTDLVYRYGGDEFVGGLAQTDIHGAVDVSERIRASVDDIDLGRRGVSLRIQISIGITLVRDSDDCLSAFKRADKALYQAKLNGKNQIVIC